MRVYELAKELGVASKDLLTALKGGGFAATSHMMVLSDEGSAYLDKKFKKQSSEKVVQQVSSPSPKKKEPKSPEVAPTQNNNTRSHSQKENIEHKTHPISAKPEMHKTVENRGTLEKDTMPSVAPYKTTPPVAPVRIEEDFEDFEAREQERIKKLLQTTGFTGSALAQTQQAPRRRRRRRSRQVYQPEAPKKPVTEISISKSLHLFEVADLFGKSPSDLIMALLKKGMVCNKNNVLNVDIIRSLGDQFGIAVHLNATESASDKNEIKKETTVAHGTTRWPVVVVMGHVDHGKTTLLDYVRKMNVAASEKGGITQHIRAWEVDSKHGKIVFLDTPGHEAFSSMRQRGATITDIVVLVVAADDGIKPQTIEAIKHAKAADVPIIVAINKIDKVQSASALETIKRQLAQHELMPEDWGGQTVVVPISAKTGKGVDDLLDMIVLQSQLIDLKADNAVAAKAFVLESNVEKGLGPVATVICNVGTLKQGDYFICGNTTGKIRLLINSHGKKVAQATPSTPVQVVGFDSMQGIGDWLAVVSQQEYAKARAQKTVQVPVPAQAQQTQIVAPTKETADAKKKCINLIIKTDTRGSKEAIVSSLDKLSKLNKEIKCPMYVISSGIGDITEGDVELAASSKALILGLHVKVEKNAQMLARDKYVDIQAHQIIYQMIDYLQALLTSKKEVVITWDKVGEATVKKVFDIKGSGIIAGCYLRDGVLTRGNKVVCMRNGKAVGEAKVISLQRDRKTVKEVHAGHECGFTAEGFNEWQEGDTVISYVEVREKPE